MYKVQTQVNMNVQSSDTKVNMNVQSSLDKQNLKRWFTNGLQHSHQKCSHETFVMLNMCRSIKKIFYCKWGVFITWCIYNDMCSSPPLVEIPPPPVWDLWSYQGRLLKNSHQFTVKQQQYKPGKHFTQSTPAPDMQELISHDSSRTVPD